MSSQRALVAAVALLVWTIVVDVYSFWAGWWVPDDPLDSGAVEAAIGLGLFFTSGLWVVGAIVVVVVLVVARARSRG